MIREVLNNINEGKTLGVLSRNDYATSITYLSPGPMKVTGNLEYSVWAKRDGQLSVPTDDQIKEAQSKTKDDFKNMVWFEPGGYNFQMLYIKADDIIIIGARPNNAVGSSLYFEHLKGGEKKFIATSKKYSTEKAIRKYLKKLDGKKAQYLNKQLKLKLGFSKI